MGNVTHLVFAPSKGMRSPMEKMEYELTLETLSKSSGAGMKTKKGQRSRMMGEVLTVIPVLPRY